VGSRSSHSAGVRQRCLTWGWWSDAHASTLPLKTPAPDRCIGIYQGFRNRGARIRTGDLLLRAVTPNRRRRITQPGSLDSPLFSAAGVACLSGGACSTILVRQTKESGGQA
jgi:hypothetical protein